MPDVMKHMKPQAFAIQLGKLAGNGFGLWKKKREGKNIWHVKPNFQEAEPDT